MANNLRVVIASTPGRYYLTWRTTGHDVTTPQRLEVRIAPSGPWVPLSPFADGFVSNTEYQKAAFPPVWEARIAFNAGFTSFSNVVSLTPHGDVSPTGDPINAIAIQDVSLNVDPRGGRLTDVIQTDAPAFGIADVVQANAPAFGIADVVLAGDPVFKLRFKDCACRDILNIPFIQVTDSVTEELIPAYLQAGEWFIRPPLGRPIVIAVSDPNRPPIDPVTVTINFNPLTGDLLESPVFATRCDPVNRPNEGSIAWGCNGRAVVRVCDFCAPPEGNDWFLEFAGIDEPFFPFREGRIESTGPNACTDLTLPFLGPGAYRFTATNAQGDPVVQTFFIG